MNINQVARLLNKVNIKTISGENFIEEYHEQGENYYKVEKKDREWFFSFVKGERKTEEEEEIKETFDNEQDASKYYYLIELSKRYHNKYIYKFQMNNEDINIGEYECSLNNLKGAFERIGVKDIYYNFNNFIKEHSICLEKIDNETSRVKFIGNYNKVIIQTLKLENWLAYYTMYRRVYALFLLDKHCELLIKAGEIDKTFTDEEYSIFIK
ncbi:hypothetical protein BJV85_001849 [Clostridium acetobutylicum]|uniref:Uncharacterized protein n=1 Tax=Clostridium acetobutylicum (strain ATCC 824 / DSM 792 / JCM 1419 / IAM 19013 / LMG 5710 / NBRC 13948 / NRRL B-527 / VKM B-1787 / 2291 / W) TaxID=272562 RepID=Q97HI3_CLOAB|nr:MULTISPECIES: hypothetical protein [Clostridium]AAK79987.1 Hypothetical protein, CF-4 family [Clostridium acetobutylicum ATCC 824]ADZ21079.1 conserved hypothetical protein [Clostridium acetobutylicum EA 2018]AEI32135.1 hypothetical protein SMB_G2060 [Clostridium acetobutylicum DSM 1731]AWV79583.1 hypothetical protein DK921_05605 [Clostridium acetobutylicum]MBC2394443.1 hypothetical protein [Clostridium acetobutylicum]